MKLKFLVLLGVSLLLISCKKTVVIEVRPAPEPITLVGTTFLDVYSEETAEYECFNNITFVDESNVLFSMNYDGQSVKVAEFYYTCDEDKKEISFWGKGIYTYLNEQRFLTSVSDIANYYYLIAIEESENSEDEMIERLAKLFDCEESKTAIINYIKSFVQNCFDQIFTVSYEFGDRVTDGVELEAFGIYDRELAWNKQPNGLFRCRNGSEGFYPIFDSFYSIVGEYKAKSIDIANDNIFENENGETITVRFSEIDQNDRGQYVVYAYTSLDDKYEYVFKPLSIADLMVVFSYGLLGL